MVRYIIRLIDPAHPLPKYISRYTPSTEKTALPDVEYTRYRINAQIFSADEVKTIPEIFGKPVELKM